MPDASLHAPAPGPETERGQTADRVLALLVLLSTAQRPMSVRELAAGVGKPLSTTYRYLGVLRDWDLVAETLDGGGYRLGARCLTLAQGFQASSGLGALCLPVMREVVAQTGESALLLIPAGGQAYCLESLDSPQPLRYSFQKGTRTGTLLQGASAKAMLPFLSERQWQEALRAAPQVAPSEAEAERERIRSQGYALSQGEVDEGVVAVGSAILGRGQTLLGAVSLVMPALRASEERCTQAVTVIRQAAQQLSALARQSPGAASGGEAWLEQRLA